MIKIDFTKTDGTYTLQDAIHLPEDHQLTEAEIEAIKQERFDNWVAIITAPEEPPVDAVVTGE
jgi:hypothetical protein